MSATNTGVPSVVRARLPSPVPAHEHESCAVTDVLRRVGDKWSVLVMVLLGRRAHRFNELHRGIEAISQRMLTRTLRTLEEDGLVRREVFPTNPPSVEYDLTPLGRSLLVPLSALADWAVEHGPQIAAAREPQAVPSRDAEHERRTAHAVPRPAVADRHPGTRRDGTPG
ncbi:winged helix-turn-helix transcriptional regulator [Cellulosimicrobium composti]|uniref:Helix-turn-helix transcriptional regulator n=1 Tax=Cellulosimicrobium composti TaxID=2672572 RepID=A0ABX0BF21_9MICO|nr:helix-turn-helix domain-containing protein [Cellulosimicrobium composti]NDO89538.1 helix-turn-helix transcriptional regulator [Cellulosimicrobium composti]